MVDREKVLAGLKSCADRTGALCRTCPYDFVHNENCMGDMARDALELLNKQPEIVRCKDCKNGAYVAQVGTLPYVICRGVDHELNWFCADGKRR